MTAPTREPETVDPVEAAEAAEAARPPRLSIRRVLGGLVAACLVPSMLALAAMVFVNYRVQEEAVRNEAVMRARTMLLLLDGDLEGVESGLRVLAGANELATNDYARFHERLRAAQKSQPVDGYLLVDGEGRVRVSTLAAGAMPSKASLATQLGPVFTAGKPSLSGVFAGPSDASMMMVVGVPIVRNDDVAYALAVVITPEQILKSTRAALPEGWVAAVLDSGGRIVARSRDAARFVGQPATPSLLAIVAGKNEGTADSMSKEGAMVMTAFSRSDRTHWIVAVGAPKSMVVASVYRSIAILALCVVVALAVVLAFAWRMSRVVTQAVGSLIEPALALGGGRPVELPPPALRETDEVGRAIRQASWMLARAQHHAYHDPLTNLRNRTLFDEMATRQIAQAYRDGAQLAILAIDLDGFKAVNDRHGHAAGDVVLKRVADRITSSIRGSDVVSRRGGDEFSVLLVDVDGIKTRHIAEKLVAALSLPYPGVDVPVSASIGVARYPHEASTLQELLERADEALYEAKNAGKRRVVGDF